MVSHGVVTGALFLLVGVLQDRAGTRETGAFGGLLHAVPMLGWAFIVAAFASLGLPGLAHFPAEFQIFLGALQISDEHDPFPNGATRYHRAHVEMR